jgi:hypothetical protein
MGLRAHPARLSCRPQWADLLRHDPTSQVMHCGPRPVIGDLSSCNVDVGLRRAELIASGVLHDPPASCRSLIDLAYAGCPNFSSRVTSSSRPSGSLWTSMCKRLLPDCRSGTSLRGDVTCSCEMSALGSSTSYSKAAAQMSARAAAFVLSMTNFQPSGIRPVSRESNDPSNCRRPAVSNPTRRRARGSRSSASRKVGDLDRMRYRRGW